MILKRIKDFLLTLYLIPAKMNFRLAMSLRNRILPDYQHIAALQLMINKMNRKLDMGNLILDVGCFEGGTCTFLSKIKNVKVIGFEANPEAFKKAVETTKNNPSVKIENFAVSETNGFADIYITDNQVSSSLNPIAGGNLKFSTKKVERVKTISLDGYLAEYSLQNDKILAIKLDVQGHELKVLRGAIKTLARTFFVLTEMSNHTDYKGGTTYFEVDALLREQGFTLQNTFAPFTYEEALYEYDALYLNRELFNRNSEDNN
jgi:FkbM family methyltransferase